MKKEKKEEDLEQRVQNKNYPIKNKGKKMFTYALVLAAGITIGTLKESKDHYVEEKSQQYTIMKKIMDGYSFTDNADPHFFKYHTTLKVDKKNKTIEGYFTKKNNIIQAGPIRKEGIIGLRTEEKAVEYGRKTINTGKEMYEQVKEKVEEIINFNKENDSTIVE